MAKSAFTRDELAVVLGTSGVYALRMFGLYMALPVMSTWAMSLPGTTTFLTGLAIGAYGLTQAIFQVPAGLLGDVRGRRVVVLLSLVVFAIGCAVVATATSIHMVIVGRLVQGAGAMASTMIALIGDATREEVRTRGMALLGVVLGVAFGAGFLTGPLVAARFGVPSVFGLAAGLSLLGAALFELVVPRRLVPHVAAADAAAPRWSWAEARSMLADRSLFVLDLGIAILHAAVTGIFVVVPIVLEHFLRPLDLWRVYAPVLAAGMAAMLWASRTADHPQRTRPILALGAVLITVGLVGLALLNKTLLGTGISLGVFVAGFGMIEPVLASLLTRFTGRGARGTAAGVFNMAQFGGAFIGGALAGFALKFGAWAPFTLLAALTATWAVTLFWLRSPEALVVSHLEAPELDPASWTELRRELVAHPAILEAEWVAGHLVTVRHWRSLLSREELAGMLRGPRPGAATTAKSAQDRDA